MSSPAADPRPSPAVAGSPTVAPPRRLAGTYVLVAVALMLLGGGAAAAARDSYGAPQVTAAIRCLGEQGIDWRALLRVDSPRQRSPEIRERIQTCATPTTRDQSLVMLAGAVLLPAAAVLLMIGGAVLVRRRLSRAAVPAAHTVAAGLAAERFEAWCDLLGLTGRRRPRLVLTAPYASGRQAFTTGLPFAAPRVVLPLGHAYLELSPVRRAGAARTRPRAVPRRVLGRGGVVDGLAERSGAAPGAESAGAVAPAAIGASRPVPALARAGGRAHGDRARPAGGVAAPA
nr:hypothetical protein GCM10020092_074980 [Actinoplanes digitatis]